MSNIYVSVSGNGYAYVDNSSPSGGETITLYAVADAGETLDDITARDYQGYAIALATVPQQTFTYNSAWGDMYISVVFSGSPTPPTPTPGWMWAILFKRKRRYF